MNLLFRIKEIILSLRRSLLPSLIFLIIFPFEGSTQLASNLDPENQISQYILKKWNTEDGLTSESTNDMLQSDDGYIWIATYTGLHRFDGKNFTVFTSENSNLPSSNILRIGVDSKKNIWIGTQHGIAIYKNGTITTPTGLEKLRDISVEDMLVTSDDNVWISSKSNELFFYRDTLLIDLTPKLKRKSTILTIHEEASGTILLGTDNSKVFRYTQEDDLIEIPFGIETNGINDIVFIGNTTYLSTGTGLFKMTTNGFIKQPYLLNTTINSLQADGDNILWMGTNRGLFRYQFNLNKLDSLTENQGLSNNLIRDVIIDREGNLWCGTYRSGFFFLTNGNIKSFSKNDGLQSNIISSVTEINENTYLIGNESGSLNRLENGVITKYESEVPIPNARLKNLFTDSKNRIWISTYAGLILLDGTRSRIYNTKNGFPDNFIRVVFEDDAGSIWVGTKNAGLIKFSSLDSWKELNISKGLSSDYIMSITQNDKGELIVGTIAGINFIKDFEVVKHISAADGLPSNFSFSTYPTPKYLWIATNDGLVGYSDEKTVVFTIKNGLPFNIIYDVFPDKEGNLWMPGEKAVLKVNLAALEKKVDSPNENIEVEIFDQSNGMKNSHCLGGVLSYTDKNGNFWIPTQDGVVTIDPSKVETPNIQSNQIIEAIYSDNLSLPISSTVTIPPLTDRIDINFTAIAFKYSDKLEFRYKLRPFDKEWINSSNSRNALYTNLPPGDYEFNLQAGINNDFNQSIVTQKIRIEASWYQTIWAKILLGVLILSFALLVYWIRLQTLTSRNRKLEKMVESRTKELNTQKDELKEALDKLSNTQMKMIQSEKMASLGILSAGIAHEINNPLNFIKGGVNILEEKIGHKKNDQSEEINKLISIIKDGVSRASKIVSSLNEFTHSREDVKASCNIHKLLENCLVMTQHHFLNKIEVTKSFSTEDPLVLGNNGKLHQAFLNIITNAAQSIEDKGTIHITTQIIKKQVVLTFKDSGKGISKKDIKRIMEPFYSTKAPGKGTGLGLSITYSIIEEHKGTINFKSESGEGTVVTISFPLFTV